MKHISRFLASSSVAFAMIGIGCAKDRAPPPPQPLPSAPVTQPAARKVPGDQLREMVLEYARQGNADQLQRYFEAGYTANVTSARNDPLLVLAAYHGQEEAVRTILACPDVEVDRLNGMGFTALTGASFQGFVPIMRLLIDKGANVNIANGAGQTPLMFAALTGRTEAVDLLLERGANKSAVDRNGNTAATLAANQGNQALAERLKPSTSAQPTTRP